MQQTCEVIAEEVSELDTLTRTLISQIVNSNVETGSTLQVVITDADGITLYDSNNTVSSGGQPFLVPEVMQAITRNRAFNSNYDTGVIYSQAAVPIYSGISLIGSVYMADMDIQQGKSIHAVQINILIISLILELAVIVFSIIFSKSYSGRLKQLTNSMRTIREGDYSQGVDLGGDDELTILGNEFNGLVSRLQTSERKRNNFVSDASHELKTPLASIKLLSDSILQNDMDVATIREFVGDIGREADRLTRMSEKLLSLTKIDAQLETDSEIIYMSPTVERVIRMLNKLAEKKNISLSMDIKEDSTVLFQEDDLYEIIFNLVENAIKYNVVGGTVNVTVLRDEDNAIIKVQDSGVGIPQDAQTHIFERFFRVDKARSRNSGGSGLGLAIVRNMVEHNNGTIAVESIVGQGTTFTVTFPVFDIDDMADTMYES